MRRNVEDASAAHHGKDDRAEDKSHAEGEQRKRKSSGRSASVDDGDATGAVINTHDATVAVMRVVCAAGARPNFMKVKPVLDALERRAVDTVLVHTGQHYDAAMNDVFFADLGIRAPDHWLGVGSGSHAEQTARVMEAFEPALSDLAPEVVVVVVGDVNSTVACALVAAKSGALVAHVEAGLRSRDWSMPEEINRVVTDRVSDYLFAPSADAVDNLRAEGYRPDQIHLVGNVMVDTLLANLDRARARPVLRKLGLEPGQYGLVTLHRPANVDDGATLKEPHERPWLDCGAASAGAPRSPTDGADPQCHRRSRRPDGHGSAGLPRNSSPSRRVPGLVLTDSGGVQEETTVLGVPCLTLRENTERPITVTEGTNTVVGHSAARIESEALRILREGVAPRRPASGTATPVSASPTHC